MTGYHNDQGRHVPTRFGYVAPLIAAMRADDPAALVSASLSAGRCFPDQAPHLPWTDPDMQRIAADALAGRAK